MPRLNMRDMPTLPQLIEEDVRRFNRILRELVDCSEATQALLIDKGGFLLANYGDDTEFDLTTIAALASGAFLANQTIASLVQEENFSSVYQQGENFSMLISNVDEHSLLVIIFKAGVAVGAVKYFANITSARVSEQMKIAHKRNPEGGLDLSVLNLENPDVVFRKKF
jgi:predicted regulator of Ras-like GTPase activity (Roadblock/LC7/MglB family)